MNEVIKEEENNKPVDKPIDKQEDKQEKIKNPNNAGRKWFDGKDEKEIVSKFKEIWALDGTDAEASFYADVSTKSISRYLIAHPEIREIRDKLKQNPVLKARRAVVNSLDNYQNAMDYLKRKKRQEFGDSLTQNVNFNQKEIDEDTKKLEHLLEGGKEEDKNEQIPEGS